MGDAEKKALGRRVATSREALGMTQGDLARAVGMKQQGIVSIEGGDVERPRKLKELAEVLQKSQEWLLGQPVKAARGGTSIATVPLIEWVSAGQLAEPRSQIPMEDVPLLAFADLGRGDFFALRVTGDSMNRVSPEGSIIVVNRADKTLVSGKYYVFQHKGMTTYKVWRPGEPSYLEPDSTEKHKPIFVNKKKDLEVIGRVRKTLLDL